MVGFLLLRGDKWYMLYRQSPELLPIVDKKQYFIQKRYHEYNLIV